MPNSSLPGLVFSFVWIVSLLLLYLLQGARFRKERQQMRERLRVARDVEDILLQTTQALTICFHYAVEDLPDTNPAKVSLSAVLRRAEAAVEKARQDIQVLQEDARSSKDLEK